MQTEADSIIDSFIIFILVITYFNRPGNSAIEKKQDDPVSKKKVKNRILPFILIAVSVKISYFFDREKSLNFPEDPVFTKVKAFV